ncbi:MAG: WD40 repeat domain-containing protein, partial [Kineosporiaceae bacterium]
RRRTRRLGLLAAALAVLVVATSATTVAAVRSRNDAEQARRVAVSRQLAAQALAVRDTDPRRAMLNAVASWRVAQTVEARSALLSLQAWPYAGLLRGASPDLDALAVSPDGRTVAVAGEGGRVELWPADGRGRFRVLDGVVPDVRSVAFSADGTTVAAGGTVPSAAGPSVRWWDVATGAERGAMTVGRVAAVAFVPGTDRLAVSQQDRAVHVWDLARRAELWRTDPADGFVWALAPSPDGSLLAGPTDAGSVALWSLADGKDVATLRGHEGRASAVAFSADGTTLASAGSDGTVRRWDVATRTAAGPVLRVPEPTPLTSVAVSADGSHVVAVGGRAVWQWQAATGGRLGSLFPGADLLQAAAFGPDGHTLYVASDDGSVSRWVIGRSVVRFTDVVHAVAFAPDGRRVAAAAQDGTTRIWSAGSGDVIRVLTGQPASDLAFSPDGTELAVAQSDGMLRRWDVSTGVERGAVDVSGAGAADVDAPRTPQGLAWSPDGSTVTAWTTARDIGTRPAPKAGTTDGTSVLVRWDVRSGRLLPVLGVPGRGVRGVGYARGGTWLVTGLASPSQAAPVPESVRVWDAATGAVVADLAEPDVLLAATAADGRSVAVATVAGDVRIRTLVAGDEAPAGVGVPGSTVRTIRVSPNRPVRYVALSPDGTVLAASVGDETALQLWDVRSGRRVASLDRHERRLERFAFSPDGRRLATTSDDGSVVVWTLDPSAVADDLCGRLVGVALAAEWRTVAETDQLGEDPCEG